MIVVHDAQRTAHIAAPYFKFQRREKEEHETFADLSISRTKPNSRWIWLAGRLINLVDDRHSIFDDQLDRPSINPCATISDRLRFEAERPMHRAVYTASDMIGNLIACVQRRYVDQTVRIVDG